MTQTLDQPVIRGVRFFLAHTPGLVRYGSKPSRDIARDATVATAIATHLRNYEAAVAFMRHPPALDAAVVLARVGAVFTGWLVSLDARGAAVHRCQQRRL